MNSSTFERIINNKKSKLINCVYFFRFHNYQRMLQAIQYSTEGSAII